MSHNPFRSAPEKPTVITLDTLPQLFAHHRAIFGGWRMVDPREPVRPDDIPEEEWAALGDPGQRALVREREARTKAERELAAARARPAPPKSPPTTAPAPAAPAAPAVQPGDQPDITKIVQDAVTTAVAAAVKPFQEREEQRDAEEAAARIRSATVDAAKDLLHDPTDAAAHIDLTTVTDGQGQADPAKIQDALKKLIEAKPHLAKTDGRRYGQPGFGAGGSTAPLEQRVQATLRRMQEGAGLRVTTKGS
ncbi:hypothetical protein GCM10022215_24240 [Nocardioides fonticola]|uniref:Uncharacterized protein n=1 Tax=Nocardioides fonticola TaxID=450363 RepID=A0ABP7XKJ2_9ACTN